MSLIEKASVSIIYWCEFSLQVFTCLDIFHRFLMGGFLSRNLEFKFYGGMWYVQFQCVEMAQTTHYVDGHVYIIFARLMFI